MEKLFEQVNELLEALKMKKLAKYKNKYQNETRKWNIEIDGELVGRIQRRDTELYGEPGYFDWSVFIYKPGTKEVTNPGYATQYIDADTTEDPNEAFKRLAMQSSTRKGTIKAIEAHGVSVKNLNKKHFKKAA